MPNVLLELCTNDPDNGLETPYVHAIEVKDAHFVATRRVQWSHRDRLHVGRTSMPYSAFKSWYGNWCWNAVVVSQADALRLLNAPWFRKAFDIEDGPDVVWRAWEKGTPLAFKTVSKQQPKEIGETCLEV